MMIVNSLNIDSVLIDNDTRVILMSRSTIKCASHTDNMLISSSQVVQLEYQKRYRDRLFDILFFWIVYSSGSNSTRKFDDMHYTLLFV